LGRPTIFHVAVAVLWADKFNRAGVIGLSSAIELQEAGYAVTIVARDFPGPAETIDPIAQINYTSPWGGAHNRWVVPALGDEIEMRNHQMALITYERMAGLALSNPEAGITFMKGIEYLEEPGPQYTSLTAERARELKMEGFKFLAADKLLDGVKWGCEYRTWCVNPMVYCSFLLRQFVYQGGRILKRELRAPIEAYHLAELGKVDMVVNASGIGFGDSRLYITRGTCSTLTRRRVQAGRAKLTRFRNGQARLVS
jgi:D-amino-acid oxidase